MGCEKTSAVLFSGVIFPVHVWHKAGIAVGCVWWETKFNLFDVIVEYIENMLALRGKAGMSERSERLAGGQIQPFFNDNPANGG